MTPARKPQEPETVPQEADDLGELFSGRTAADGDLLLYLYRLKPAVEHGAGPAYLAKFEGTTALEYDEVKRRWGGGQYRAILKRAVGGKIVRSATFTIAGAPREDAGGDGERPPSSAPAGDRLSELEAENARLRRQLGRGSADDDDDDFWRNLRRLQREQAAYRMVQEPAHAGLDYMGLINGVVDLLDRVRDREAERDVPPWTETLATAALRFLDMKEHRLPPGAVSAAAGAPALRPQQQPQRQAGDDPQADFLARLRDAAIADEDPARWVDEALSIFPENFRTMLPRIDGARFLAIVADVGARLPEPVTEFTDHPIQAWLLRFRNALLERISGGQPAGSSSPPAAPGAEPAPSAPPREPAPEAPTEA